MRRPRMSRSRSIPSNSATRGKCPQVSKPKLRNSARLGSLCPKMKASRVAYSEFSGAIDRPRHQFLRVASSLCVWRDVDTDLRSRMVRRTAVKGLQTEPSHYCAGFFQHPQRPRARQMLIEPLAAALDAHRREIRGRHPSRNRRIVDGDDHRKVVDARVPYLHHAPLALCAGPACYVCGFDSRARSRKKSG